MNGRSYLVAPFVSIVPGVLNGSRGALFYPKSEIAKNPGVWNAIPLTLGHPTDPITNLPQSARQPDVLNRVQLGSVFNDTVTNDGRRAGEAWFDEELTRNKSPFLHKKLELAAQGHTVPAIELSTGLYTENIPAHNGSNHNGVEYTHIATEYKPDHLAILPDQKGACSNQDGCGVIMNAADDDEGRWVTMSGARVFIKGGEIVHGGPGPNKKIKEGEEDQDEHHVKAKERLAQMSKEALRSTPRMGKLVDVVKSKPKEAPSNKPKNEPPVIKRTEAVKKATEKKSAWGSLKSWLTGNEEEAIETLNTILSQEDEMVDNSNPEGINQYTKGGSNQEDEGLVEGAKVTIKPGSGSFSGTTGKITSGPHKSSDGKREVYRVKTKSGRILEMPKDTLSTNAEPQEPTVNLTRSFWVRALEALGFVQNAEQERDEKGRFASSGGSSSEAGESSVGQLKHLISDPAMKEAVTASKLPWNPMMMGRYKGSDTADAAEVFVGEGGKGPDGTTHSASIGKHYSGEGYVGEVTKLNPSHGGGSGGRTKQVTYATAKEAVAAVEKSLSKIPVGKWKGGYIDGGSDLHEVQTRNAHPHQKKHGESGQFLTVAGVSDKQLRAAATAGFGHDKGQQYPLHQDADDADPDNDGDGGHKGTGQGDRDDESWKEQEEEGIHGAGKVVSVPAETTMNELLEVLNVCDTQSGKSTVHKGANVHAQGALDRAVEVNNDEDENDLHEYNSTGATMSRNTSTCNGCGGKVTNGKCECGAPVENDVGSRTGRDPVGAVQKLTSSPTGGMAALGQAAAAPAPSAPTPPAPTGNDVTPSGTGVGGSPMSIGLTGIDPLGTEDETATTNRLNAILSTRTSQHSLSTNSNPEDFMVLSKEQRGKAVNFLTVNCSCWKGKENLLNNKEVFTDEQITNMVLEADKANKNAIVANAATKGVKLANGKTLTFNTFGKPVVDAGVADGSNTGVSQSKGAAVKADPEEGEEASELSDGVEVGQKVADIGDEKAVTGNAAVQAWLRRTHAPAIVVEAVTQLTANKDSEKNQLIQALTANVRDPQLKARLVANHSKKGIPQLKDEVAALGLSFNQQYVAPVQPQPTPSYGPDLSFLDNGPTGNASSSDEGMILRIPKMNWDTKEAM